MSIASSSCSICFCRQDESEKCPYVIPCGHTFCKSCLEKLDCFIEERKHCKKCPVCNKKYQKNAESKNQSLMTLVSQEDSNIKNICHEHTLQCNLQCVDCNTNICSNCIKKGKKHQRHAIVDQSEKNDQDTAIKQTKELINKVQYKKTEYKNKISKAEEINQETEKQIDEDKENFVKIICHQQKILEKLKNDYINSQDTLKKQIKMVINNYKTDIKEQSTNLNNYVKNVKKDTMEIYDFRDKIQKQRQEQNQINEADIDQKSEKQCGSYLEQKNKVVGSWKITFTSMVEQSVNLHKRRQMQTTSKKWVEVGNHIKSKSEGVTIPGIDKKVTEKDCQVKAIQYDNSQIEYWQKLITLMKDGEEIEIDGLDEVLSKKDCCLRALEIQRIKDIQSKQWPYIWFELGNTLSHVEEVDVQNIGSFSKKECQKKAVEFDMKQSVASFNLGETLEINEKIRIHKEDGFQKEMEKKDCYKMAIMSDKNQKEAWKALGDVLYKSNKSIMIQGLSKGFTKFTYKDCQRKCLDIDRSWIDSYMSICRTLKEGEKETVILLDYDKLKVKFELNKNTEFKIGPYINQ